MISTYATSVEQPTTNECGSVAQEVDESVAKTEQERQCPKCRKVTKHSVKQVGVWKRITCKECGYFTAVQVVKEI